MRQLVKGRLERHRGHWRHGDLPLDPQPHRPAEGRIGRELPALIRHQPQRRHAARDLLEHDLELQAGERCAEAVMDAEAERQVVPRVLAVDVEAVGLGEVRVVAVPRAQRQ